VVYIVRLILWALVVVVGSMVYLLPPSLDEADLTPGEVVRQWIQLYGQDTVRAAALTTEHFRKGEQPQEWAKRIQRELEAIDYQHLVGEITEETLNGKLATVTVHAGIVAIDGVSTQTEIYTLKRVHSRWLIDHLEVTDEIIPGGKNPHAF